MKNIKKTAGKLFAHGIGCSILCGVNGHFYSFGIHSAERGQNFL